MDAIDMFKPRETTTEEMRTLRFLTNNINECEEPQKRKKKKMILKLMSIEVQRNP